MGYAFDKFNKDSCFSTPNVRISLGTAIEIAQSCMCFAITRGNVDRAPNKKAAPKERLSKFNKVGCLKIPNLRISF